MQITLNGKPYPLAAPTNIRALADALGLDPKQVAIERNRAIVPRSQYGATMLEEGDEIEIVRFIGGG